MEISRQTGIRGCSYCLGGPEMGGTSSAHGRMQDKERCPKCGASAKQEAVTLNEYRKFWGDESDPWVIDRLKQTE